MFSDAAGVTKTRAERIARTESVNAAVDACRVRYEQAGVTEFEYIAASDDRLCAVCAANNGKIFKLTDNAHLPPIHPNCRCAIAPVIGDRDEIIKQQKVKEEAEALAKQKVDEMLETAAKVKEKEKTDVLNKLKRDNEEENRRKREENTRDANAKIISDKISKSKDHKELENTIHEVWSEEIKFTPAVKNLDFEAVKNNFAAISPVMEDFPIIKASLKSVTAQKEKGVMSIMPIGEGINTRLNINSEKYDPKNIERTKTHYQTEFNNMYWHPFGTTYKDTMIHETAHIIEWTILVRRDPDAPNILLINRWNNCSVAQEIIEKALMKIKKAEKVSDKDMRDAIADISIYAVKENPPWSEAMAEAFADYYSNKGLAKKISKEIVYIAKGMIK